MTFPGLSTPRSCERPRTGSHRGRSPLNGSLLDQQVEVLERIRRLIPDDKSAWDADERTRLAVERLWITAGNVSEAHRIVAGIDVGADPWAKLYRFRNLLAHALPRDLSSDRVWAETTADMSRLSAAVREQGS